MIKIRLTSSQFDMYHNEKHQVEKKNKLYVSDSFICISKGYGHRWYWILDRLKLSEKPLMKYNDEKQMLEIHTFKLIIHLKKYYEQIKKCLFERK